MRGDGVRFVWIQSTTGPPWVFDTLAGRSFQPPPPFPDCHPVHVAGGVVLWRCLSAGVPLVTYLATGATREPAGWAAVEATETPYSNCDADRIGRHWLQYTCRALMGGDPSPEYLNHRTGAGGALPDGTYLGSPLIDFDYAGLVRPPCAPLDPTRLEPYLPPFGLEFKLRPVDDVRDEIVTQIRLRRCGRERAEILSRCRSGECVAPRLGSRYVTWGEDERVLAYLPRIHRRVLVGRAPAELRGSQRRTLDVEHTCNRVFAEWSRRLYVARFKPRRGTPPCQTRRRDR